MHSLTKWALAPALALAVLAVTDVQSAKAQFGIGISVGNPGFGVHPGFSPYGGFGHPAYGGVYGIAPRTSFYSSSYRSFAAPHVRSSYYYQAPRTSYYGITRIPQVVVTSPSVRYYGGRRACY